MGLKLNGATSGSIELDPQANLGSDRVITLNATGNSTLTLPDANGTLDRLERAGNILQVKQTHLNTTSSTALTAGTRTLITGLSATITPTSTANKIMVFVRWCGELDSWPQDMVFGLSRNGTTVGHPANSGSRQVGHTVIALNYHGDFVSTPDTVNFNYLDSPNSTAALTYQANVMCANTTTLFNQRCTDNSDVSSRELLTSSITLMEVAG